MKEKEISVYLLLCGAIWFIEKYNYILIIDEGFLDKILYFCILLSANWSLEHTSTLLMIRLYWFVCYSVIKLMHLQVNTCLLQNFFANLVFFRGRTRKRTYKHSLVFWNLFSIFDPLWLYTDDSRISLRSNFFSSLFNVVFSNLQNFAT